MNKKINIVVGLLVGLTSVYANAYGSVEVKLSEKKYECQVKSEEGLETKLLVTHSLLEKRRKTTPVSRITNFVIDEVDARQVLSAKVLEQYNANVDRDSNPGRTPTTLAPGFRLFLAKREAGLGLETQLADITNSSVSISDEHNVLALVYQVGEFHYSDGVPLSAEVKFESNGYGAMNIDADIYYKFITAKGTVEHEFELKGTCTEQ